jgi:hypothetical protein
VGTISSQEASSTNRGAFGRLFAAAAFGGACAFGRHHVVLREVVNVRTTHIWLQWLEEANERWWVNRREAQQEHNDLLADQQLKYRSVSESHVNHKKQ